MITAGRKHPIHPSYYPQLLTTGQLPGNLTTLSTVILLTLLSKHTPF